MSHDSIRQLNAGIEASQKSPVWESVNGLWISLAIGLAKTIVAPFLVRVVKSIQKIVHRPTPGPGEMRSEDGNIAHFEIILTN